MLALKTVPIRPAGPDNASEARIVGDVMRPDIPVVSPETALHEAVRLLLAQRLPALPVVDSKGRVVGVLNEHDLAGRLTLRRGRPWWHLFVDTEQLAREYRKATGTTVGDVMTHPVATVNPTAALETVARLFDTPELDLVPVVLAGRLVGAVGRRDLVATLATIPAAPVWRADAELLTEMRERMAQEAWISKLHPTVDADHGVLTLWGLVNGEEERAALCTMARSIPGCKAVEDHLLVRGAIYRYHEIV